MSTVDPNAIFISPLDGTSLVILVTAVVCGTLSALVVSLRTYIRLHEQVFGWDDGLMLSGMVRPLGATPYVTLTNDSDHLHGGNCSCLLGCQVWSWSP